MKDYDLSKMSLSQIVSLVSSDQELRLTIAENMEEYGGSFVKALSKCFVTADRRNTERLTEAFMDYVLEYQPKKWANREEEPAIDESVW